MSEFSVKLLLGQGLAFTALRVCSMGFSALGALWVARNLGPEKLGISGWILAWITPLTLLTQFGLSALVIREYQAAKDRAEYIGKIFTQRLLFVFIWLTLLLVFFIFWSCPPGYELAIAAGVLVYAAQQLNLAWVFQAEQRMRAFFLATFLPSIFIAFGYLLVVRKSSVAGIDIAVQGVVAAVVLPILWLSVRKLHGTIKIPNVWVVLRETVVLCFRGRWMFFSGVTIYAYTTVEQPLIAWLTNVESLGRYRSAIMVCGVLASVFGIFQQMLFPRFVAWHAESPMKLWVEVNRLFKMSVLVMIPASVVGGGILYYLYPLIFGLNYSDAAGPAVILAVSKVVVFLNGLFGWALWADQNNDKIIAGLMLIIAVISIVLNILLIPRWGILAAAIINLSSEIFILGGTYMICRRRYGSLQ